MTFSKATYTYKRVGECDIKVDVYRSPGKDVRPVIVHPDKEPGKLELYSPIRHVTNAYPPTLLLHGDKDTDVPFEESARMAAALKQVGVPHQLIRMHNYDHLFDVFPTGWTPDAEPLGLKDPKVASAYDDVVAFLRKHIAR